jgi:hypothetical protein
MNVEEKECPFCREIIKISAIKCKHCQSNLSADAEANRLPDSRDYLDSASSTSYQTVPHGYAVAAVLVPIISIVFSISISYYLSFVRGNFSIERFELIYSGTFFTIGTVVLNSIFCIADQRALEKHGVKVKYGISMAILLVPVYLYFRGAAINKVYRIGWLKTQGSFIGWIISVFAATIVEQYMLDGLYY